MDELPYQSLRDALRRPAGIEAAREFLQTYVSDAHMEQLRAIIEHMRNVNAGTIIDGLEGLDDVLAETHPAGVLADLVARDANRSLDDPSDEGARIWLAQLAGRVRAWLGDATSCVLSIESIMWSTCSALSGLPWHQVHRDRPRPVQRWLGSTRMTCRWKEWWRIWDLCSRDWNQPRIPFHGGS